MGVPTVSADSTTVIVGIDISKDDVDFFVLNWKGYPSGRRPRRATDLAILATELAALKPRLVVLEATGGLETPVWAALEAAGLRVAVVNPKRVRDFARSLGLLAKTDPLDARMLARFGELLGPAPTRLPDRVAREGRELLRHLDALAGTRAQHRTRRRQLAGEGALASVERVIASLSEEIALLEQQIKEALRQQPGQCQRAAQLRTAPGVGPRPLGPWWPSCLSWDNSADGKSPPWPLWRRWPATADVSADGAGSSAAAHACARRCIWRRDPRFAATPTWPPSGRACWQRASPSRSR